VCASFSILARTERRKREAWKRKEWIIRKRGKKEERKREKGNTEDRDKVKKRKKTIKDNKYRG
jgi:hypothetical protein